MRKIANGEGSSQSTTLIEMSHVNVNEKTTVSAVTIAEKRKNVNRNYYHRNKENNTYRASVNTQGTSDTGKEGTTPICSDLTHQNFNGKTVHFFKNYFTNFID